MLLCNPDSGYSYSKGLENDLLGAGLTMTEVTQIKIWFDTQPLPLTCWRPNGPSNPRTMPPFLKSQHATARHAFSSSNKHGTFFHHISYHIFTSTTRQCLMQ
jgi:hypothetical protein